MSTFLQIPPCKDMITYCFVILIKILLCRMCPWLTRRIILFDGLRKCHLLVRLQHYDWGNVGLGYICAGVPAVVAQWVGPIGHRWEILQRKTSENDIIQLLVFIKFIFPSTCGFIPNYYYDSICVI